MSGGRRVKVRLPPRERGGISGRARAAASDTDSRRLFLRESDHENVAAAAAELRLKGVGRDWEVR